MDTPEEVIEKLALSDSTDEELDRARVADRLRAKASHLREAADLIEEYKPKAAAALWGDAHSAMVEWSRMVEV